MVGPKSSGWCEEFSSNYEKVCAEINLPLAPECPKKEKAFKNETVGKVLGIEFDTNTLSWRLPEQKIEKILRVINEINSKEEVGLHEMQVLMGNSNTVSMMSPFLNVFKRPLNVWLAHLQVNEDDKIKLSEQAVKDLSVWRNFLCDSEK